MEILISGAGIAGLTLALCLQRLGHHPVILEKSRQLRSGGYMVDFFGPGYDAAENLGLLPDLEHIHYPIEDLAFVGPRGKEKFSLKYRRVRRLFDNRDFNFLRGDLEELLYRHIEGKVEVHCGTSVVAIDQDGATVDVLFAYGTRRGFDLVVGADGLHSGTRSLVFGEEKQFFRILGHNTAAFMMEGHEAPGIRAGAFQTMTVPGRQVALYPVRGNRLATFFLYRSRRLGDYSGSTASSELRRVFDDLDWAVPSLLRDGLETNEVYFDAVAQIEMPRWSRGQVTLVGDSCWCLSLLAGQGASMAMFGASTLAEELGSGEDVDSALGRYEERLRPMILERQAAGRNMANWFVPDNKFQLVVRDLLTRTSTWPVVSSIFKRSLLVGSHS